MLSRSLRSFVSGFCLPFHPTYTTDANLSGLDAVLSQFWKKNRIIAYRTSRTLNGVEKNYYQTCRSMRNQAHTRLFGGLRIYRNHRLSGFSVAATIRPTGQLGYAWNCNNIRSWREKLKWPTLCPWCRPRTIRVLLITVSPTIASKRMTGRPPEVHNLAGPTLLVYVYI